MKERKKRVGKKKYGIYLEKFRLYRKITQRSENIYGLYIKKKMHKIVTFINVSLC